MIDLIVLDRTAAGRLLSHPEKSKEITHVISIYNPPCDSERDGYQNTAFVRDKPCAGFYKFSGKKISLVFDDVVSMVDPSCVLPSKEHVQQIIDFAADMATDIAFDKKPKVLIHCYAGISRSTAAAMIVLARLSHKEKANEHYKTVLAVRDIAEPNTLMLEYADTMMGLNGALINSLPPRGRTYGWP